MPPEDPNKNIKVPVPMDNGFRDTRNTSNMKIPRLPGFKKIRDKIEQQEAAIQKIERLRGRVASLEKRLGKFRAMSDAVETASVRHPEVKTIVDVGAALGNWTRMCLGFYPDAKFLLFEPQPVHEESLSALCGEFGDQVSWVKAAAGKEKGRIFFDVSDPLGGQASDKPYEEHNLEVEMCSIDEELERLGWEGPYMLKLDVHGFEVPILEGAEKTLRNCAVAIIECYNFPIAEGSLELHEMCDWMGERGFQCVDATSPHQMEEHGDRFWFDLVFSPKK